MSEWIGKTLREFVDHEGSNYEINRRDGVSIHSGDIEIGVHYIDVKTVNGEDVIVHLFVGAPAFEEDDDW